MVFLCYQESVLSKKPAKLILILRPDASKIVDEND